MPKKLLILIFAIGVIIGIAFLNCPTTASDSSSGGGSTGGSTSSTSSTGGSTVNHDLYINFQTLASGLSENIETTIQETVLPTVRNASNLAVYMLFGLNN